MKFMYSLLLLLSLQKTFLVYAVNKDVETHQQIKLEDIEQDNLTSEKIKELLETQQTQNIKTSSTEEANGEETSKEQTRESVQYVEPSSASVSGINYDGYLSLRYLTPGPGINYVHNKAEQQQQPEIQYVPQVHEADITYTVPSRQSLVKPFIGGGAPIHPIFTPQPQYVYIQAQPSGPSGPGPVQKQQQQETIQKTVYQQEQEEKNRGNYLQFISPSPGYVMVPYPYQLPHPQHIAQHLPPPILPSVAPSSVLAYSQGETGTNGALHTSTSRPFVPYSPFAPPTVAPLNDYSSASLKSVAPIRYSPKYTTTIEPQLIVGPISLPPTIEYSHPINHHHSYRYTQPSQSLPFSFNGFSNFLKRPYEHFLQAASVIMPRQKPAPTLTSYAYNPSYTGPLQNYNTIAYSVPYSPTKMFLKRDVKKSDSNNQ